MQIGILGIGGIGGFLAAVLSKNNQNVVCITSKETKDYIQSDSFELLSKNFGNFKIKSDACNILNADLDVLFITTKNQYLKDSLQKIPQEYLKNCIVIPLLNGVAHRDLLTDIYKDSIITGTIGGIEVEKQKNQILHLSHNLKPTIDLATNNTQLDLKLESVSKILQNAGINANIHPEISHVTWGKLVRLDVISSFSAAYDQTVGELRSDELIRNEMKRYIRETIEVASLEGYVTSCKIIMNQIDQLPHDLKTSLQKDIKLNKESELESITGGVIKLALDNDIEISNHDLIYNKIQLKSKKLYD
ncbi:2-dehydropantoate 2-reductase [Gammaproteobacteria bacterium]|jgi:2-dehydropantoate 2-reductase|nr:2-dehydropantoate 2-reductase [Gammaproteobacteria bacterium]